MPLFGPNINKMAEKRDVAGLLKVTQEGSPNDRIKAIEAISEIGDTDALQKAIRNQSTDAMFSIWDKAIGSVTKLPNGDTVSLVLLGLLVSDIKEGMQKKVFETLKSMGTLKDAQLWSRTGVTLIDKKRTGLALQCFDQAVKLEPNNKELIGSIAGALLDKACFEPALTHFQKFSELDPKDARGWGGQGLCLANLKRLEEARNACLKALEIDSSSKAVRDALGSVYCSLGDYDKAVSLAHETLEMDPSNVEARLILSNILALSGKLAEAEAEATKTLEAIHSAEYADAESLSMVYQHLGVLSVMRGHKEKARAAFQKAIDAEPTDEWVRALLTSYEILDLVAIAMKGTPSDRRTRLFSLAEKRTQARKGQGLSQGELAIVYLYRDDSPFPYMRSWTEDFWLGPLLRGVVLKLWPPEYVGEAIRIISSKGILEAFQRGLEEDILQ